MSKQNQIQEKVKVKNKPLIYPQPRKEIIVKPTPAGTKTIIKARLYVDEHGKKCAEPGDKFDLYGYVQASKASTDIASIVARAQAGDTSVLNVRSDGISGDITGLPKNINDVMAIGGLSDQAKQRYDQLPNEIKALFGNDSAQFFTAVINGQVDAILNKYFEGVKAAATAEIKPEEKEINKEENVNA